MSAPMEGHTQSAMQQALLAQNNGKEVNSIIIGWISS